jgi:hypothetical protein
MTTITDNVPGTDIPGALWRASTAAVRHEDCSRCHAKPGQPCATEGGTDLCRAIAAFLGGHLAHADIAVVISWGAVHCGDGIVIPALDGGES